MKVPPAGRLCFNNKHQKSKKMLTPSNSLIGRMIPVPTNVEMESAQRQRTNAANTSLDFCKIY